jgi:hypothetical protein
MIYVQANVLGSDESALLTRSYLAALALVTEVPVRAVWTVPTAVQPDEIDPEAPGVYDMASRVPGAPQAVLRIGSLAEVTGRPLEAAYSIALTWWAPGRLTRAMRARLDSFSEVWVPCVEHADDYPRAVVVPIPFDLALWGANASQQQRAPGLYAVGRWSTGALEDALATCRDLAAGRGGTVPITIAAPDLPEADPRLEGVRLIRTEPPSFRAARALHLMAGDTYVGPAGFHAAAADACGNASGVLAHPRDVVAAMIAQRLSEVKAEAPPEPEPVPAMKGPLLPFIAFIIPVRDVEAGLLEETLSVLMAQLAPGDEVVLSAQGSSDGERLRRLAIKHGTTLVVDDYFGVWNIARARNAGFLALRSLVTMAPRYVVALDADLRLPEGWLARARDIVQQQNARETTIFIPLAEDETGQRKASGAALLPRGFVESARGWDEEYLGYGAEDLDLIHRLRTGLGAGLVVLTADDLAPLQHVAHPPRRERAEYGPAGDNRLAARIRGTLTGPVNMAPGAWRSSTTTAVTIIDGRIMDEDEPC